MWHETNLVSQYLLLVQWSYQLDQVRIQALFKDTAECGQHWHTQQQIMLKVCYPKTVLRELGSL